MEKKFEAPGPGSWQLETTHFSGPITQYMQALHPEHFARGFKEGTRRYGSLLSHLQPGIVNGFVYMKQVVVGEGEKPRSLPPKLIFMLVTRLHPEFRRRGRSCKRAIRNRLWLTDLEEWDKLKTDSIRRNQTLQQINLKQISDEELIDHLLACKDNLAEMIYRHHKYNISALMPVAQFLAVATDGSGVTSSEAINLLKGSTPVSRGAAEAEFNELVRVLKLEKITLKEFQGLTAPQIINTLGEQTPVVSSALNQYLNMVKYMLISGYDITNLTVIEKPELLVNKIRKSLNEHRSLESESESKRNLERLTETIRIKIPERNLSKFDLYLEDARIVNRLRDERSIYNDVWATGIARQAILESGRRLVTKGILEDAELLLEATHEEMVSQLKGKSPVSSSELGRRKNQRITARLDDMPEHLGPPPSDPPPIDWLPENLRLGIAPMLIASENLEGKAPQSNLSTDDVLKGTGVSSGTYEGIVRVIKGPEDFSKLVRGDVLVTKNTSAAFNIVLPTIGALVTDRGGILSHAAIVSREFGIPGVVGARTATGKLKDGDRVRVDGDEGSIFLIS